MGFFYAFITALMWGLLPIGLKIHLEFLDASTLNWFRFFVAGVFTATLLYRRNQLSFKKYLTPSLRLPLLIAALGLIGNYGFYAIGLQYIPPGTAQVVIQLAPSILLLGSLIFFKESFSLTQGVGFAIVFLGLALFFNHRLEEIFSQLGDYTIGILFVAAAAASWATYALGQKAVGSALSPQETLLGIYIVGTLFFTPAASPLEVIDFTLFQWLIFAFVAANTIIAYGAFAAAMDCWESSRVSAVLTLIPVLTLLGVTTLEAITPHYQSGEVITWLSWLGATTVVCGSLLAALGRKKSSS
ncbi:MAG: DMT family transporter [Cellvibrionaceae bacterium]